MRICRYQFGKKPKSIIRRNAPTLPLKIYATILYYLHEKDRVSQYLADWLEHCQKGEQEQDLNPPAFVEKMRKLKAEKAAAQSINEYSVSNR